jgi:hypothetical protein
MTSAILTDPANKTFLTCVVIWLINKFSFFFRGSVRQRKTRCTVLFPGRNLKKKKEKKKKSYFSSGLDCDPIYSLAQINPRPHIMSALLIPLFPNQNLEISYEPPPNQTSPPHAFVITRFVLFEIFS